MGPQTLDEKVDALQQLNATPDAHAIDAAETRDWLESLEDLLHSRGHQRVREILSELQIHAQKRGVALPMTSQTPYVNTILADRQPPYPGNRELERRIKSIIRWNAMAMVVKANRENEGIGGHISSYASCATLYEVGFNHFFRGPDHPCGGDLVFFQGHASPGIYSRAYIEGRLTGAQLHNFRRDLAEAGGATSYPHPWLMPDFWQFPTVSMGLGPIMAIYQARFIRYLDDRGLRPYHGQKVWAFLGDGETDEPESLGAITLASRERLDNLIFVVNCNLQRLDGPVRGNGSIVQELEAVFRGAGWNVIKVLWGSDWDELLARDEDGRLARRMGEIVDGEYQKYAVEGGAYIRRHFWEVDPKLANMVRHMSDDQLWRMNLGGHDPAKVYAAYKAAFECIGRPTVILARTIKGYGLGEAGEGKNITHQQKKLNEDEMLHFRDRFRIPLSDEEVRQAPFYRPSADSPEMAYIHDRRRLLGGYLPQRRNVAPDVPMPEPASVGRIPDRQRRAGGVHHDGLRPHSDQAAQGQTDWPAHRADRAGRSPHVRHGSAVPAVRHLLARRAVVRAGGCRSVDVLQGGARRPDSGRGHQRSGVDEFVHRRRHGVRQPERVHDPVLHLLLDVRFPAHRRLDLGGGRFADPRFPGRRDGRPHHAQRRRSAASGRPLAPAGHVGAEPAGLRSGICLRDRGDRSRRAAADVCAEGRHLLLPDRRQRELRAGGHAGGCGRGHPEGHVPVPPRGAQWHDSWRSTRRPACWAAVRS